MTIKNLMIETQAGQSGFTKKGGTFTHRLELQYIFLAF